MTKGAFWIVGFVIAASAGCSDHIGNANEIAVVRELQMINSAQVQYMSKFHRFATSLAQLGPSEADLIRAPLASGDHDGYFFVMRAPPSGYAVNANPKAYKTTGWRTFYTDQTAVIHENRSAKPATAASPELKLAPRVP